MGAVIDTSAYPYKTIRVRGKDGKLHYIRSNGDSVVKALTLHTIVNGKPIEQVVRANKLILSDFTNSGQLRMAVGTRLRTLIRSGTPVVVGDITLKSLDQKVALVVEERRPAAEKPVKKATEAKSAKKATRKRSDKKAA